MTFRHLALCPRVARVTAAGLVLSAALCASTAAQPTGDPPVSPTPDEPVAGLSLSDRTVLLQAFSDAIDAETMARTVAGRYWAGMDKAERSGFITRFARHLVALAADFLPEGLSGSDLGATTVPLSGGDTLALVTLGEEAAAPRIGLRMRDVGEPRIVDILVAGVSLLRLKRAEFAALAERGGVAAVMAALEERSRPAIALATTRSVPEPAQVAEAAPAPAAAPAELRRTLFFALESAELSAEAQRAAEEIARLAAMPDATTVAVTGFADPSGSDAFNTALSRRRAERVAEALAAAGVPKSRIRIQARGEEAPAPGVLSSAERRRVEILVMREPGPLTPR